MTHGRRAVAACGNLAWLSGGRSTDGGEVHGVVLTQEGVIEGVAHELVSYILGIGIFHKSSLGVQLPVFPITHTLHDCTSRLQPEWQQAEGAPDVGNSLELHSHEDEAPV